MFVAIRGTALNGLVFASVTAIGMIAWPADEPQPEEILRDNGLARSGAAYVLKGEEDVRDRVAEIGRLIAEWKQAKAAVDERLATLGRLRLQYDEVATKLRALEIGPRPPPFPDDGPRGPGAGPPPPGSGPPPPPPDDMNGFGPGAAEDFVRLLGLGDKRRQYNNWKAEQVARGAEIAQAQILSEELVKRFEAQLGEIEQRRLEAVGLDKEIRANYDRLAREPRVKQALATLNAVSSPKLALGPSKDYSKSLAELAATLAESREEMLKQLASVQQKGVRRFTGLVLAAETLLQKLAINAGRMQNLEREASSRKKWLADHVQQQASLGEQLRRAADSIQRNQIATELHAEENRTKLLHAEEVQARGSIGEVVRLVASEREDYLRVVKALQAAIDEADKKRQTSNNDSSTRKSESRASRDDGRSDEVGSTDRFKNKLKEFEKTIRSENVAIDADKTINWVDVTLNGKAGKLMMIDLGMEELRLTARLATEVGIRLAPGDPVVEIRTTDGRTIPARKARLESVRVGPFTQHDVDCFVLPDSVGEVPSLLGASFFKHFSTRIDAEQGVIVLTQVQVKPILHSSKGLSTKSAGSAKSKKAAPATARSPAN